MSEPSSSASAAGQPVIKKKTLSKKKTREFEAEQENRSVLYVARIPPYLKPLKLRNLLEGYGTEVLRVYLSPEDTANRSRRLRAGGNKKKNFTDGWVEFADKRRAKRIASTLNNTAMDPLNKAGFYAHDLWNIRYLPKFKWHHLTEKVAAEAIGIQQLVLRLSHCLVPASGVWHAAGVLVDGRSLCRVPLLRR